MILYSFPYAVKYPLNLLFPPKVFLDSGAAGSKSVVGVHDNMDSGVEKGSKSAVSATNKSLKVVIGFNEILHWNIK